MGTEKFGDRMLILGDRVFESTLGEGDRVSLEETTLEEGIGGVWGDKPWRPGAGGLSKLTCPHSPRVASDLSYYNSGQEPSCPSD